MAEVNLTQARQYYRAAQVDSEEHAQRLMSLGVGGLAMVLLMTAPALGPLFQFLWVAIIVGAGAGLFLFRRHMHERLREAILTQQLQRYLPLDMELWDRVGAMRDLPAPLNSYVEHVLETYIDFRAQVSDRDEVELGQVQLIHARDRLFEYLDLAERTGAIRTVLETQAGRISDEDQISLRQRFGEQCAGLQQIAQSFDRTVGNLAVAQVLGGELGETSIDDVAERMHEIESELDEVKRSMSVDA
ncbi:MAG: hypothetical protein HYU66_23555 [Armatimonadetes bacterium]|nr:hypothetical protein [Armatimonadota bacterium]